MYATIQKWGGHQALCIPDALLEAIGVRENDQVELIQLKDSIQIRKPFAPRHRTLEERLSAYYGKSADDIARLEAEPEIDWGKPEGAEIW